MATIINLPEIQVVSSGSSSGIGNTSHNCSGCVDSSGSITGISVWWLL